MAKEKKSQEVLDLEEKTYQEIKEKKRSKAGKFFNNLGKDFKVFITKGNVLDMAVGVIIGGAFSAVVTALSNQILSPLINWLIAACTGGKGLESAYTMLCPYYEPTTGELVLNKSIYIDWGAFISAIINFLLIAVILFAIVKIAASVIRGRDELKKKTIEDYYLKHPEERPVYTKKVEDTELSVLLEIRDELKKTKASK